MNGAPERAKILWTGTVSTADDGHTPIVEGWGFDCSCHPNTPAIDHECGTIYGWPIHELAALAARGD